MPPNRFESEAPRIDFAFKLQRERHQDSSQDALSEIIANTHPSEVIGDYEDYWTAVARLHERVIHAEPWQRLGSVVLKGRFEESVTKDDLAVRVRSGRNPLEDRIGDVVTEMAAMMISPQPEDATKLKLLELDHVLLTAQRYESSLDRPGVVTVALSGIEQIEQTMHHQYEVLMEQPSFEKRFKAEFDGLDGEVSIEQVIAAEKHAFDVLVAQTYNVAELHKLHELAVSMQEEIKLRDQVLDIVRQIVPSATHAAEERIAENIPMPASLVLAA